jgi:hypothetical protein
MHKIHGGFTAAFPIDLEKETKNEKEEKETNIPKTINSTLALLHNNGNSGSAIFEGSKTTLFLSGVVLPAEKKLPRTFVLATTYCGPLKAHLYDLIATNKAILIKLLMFCKDFNAGYNASDDYIYAFLKKHGHYSNFNSRCNYISKQDIKDEKELRKEIENYIDQAQQLGAFKNRSAEDVKKLIQRHIRTRGDKFEWAFKPCKKNPHEMIETARVSLLTILWIVLAAAIVIAPFLVPVLWPGAHLALKLIACIPLVSILLAVISFQFKNSQPAQQPSDERLQELAATQLNPVLNEMTASAPLKAGFLRPYFYALALRILGSIGPALLKIPTVSNIRWLVIDNKKRLVFLSCFSNTTDFYVRDFIIGNTARGLNFMFTHGEGFPKSLFTWWQGILSQPEEFMHAVHKGQQATGLWYAHEPNLTADIINKNRKIRNGLFKEMMEDEAGKWLKLL